MGAEDIAENQDQEGYRLLWEILQSPVRDTFRSRNLLDVDNPNGFLKLLMVG